ncbi:hypothetical protein BU15DRAFT_67297 [Melanogaster broomeanus]|nr:hypothetical protein BU15DRAFT_67297 [Melanogaster broomeanus]
MVTHSEDAHAPPLGDLLVLRHQASVDIGLFVHRTSALDLDLLAEEGQRMHQCRSDGCEGQAVRNGEGQPKGKLTVCPWTRNQWDALPSIITLSRSIVSLSPSLRQRPPYSLNIIDQPTSMSHDTTMMEHTDRAFGKIEEQYRDYPPKANDEVSIGLITWVVTMMSLLLSSLRATILNFHKFNAEILAHIDILEEAAATDSSSKESGGAPPLINRTEPRQAKAPARGGADA